jgi:uncharacterized protein
MIYETVVVTEDRDGNANVAPLGVREEGELLVLAPFRPSTTLHNLELTGEVVVNMTDDVAVIAGCLTGHKDWPLLPAAQIKGWRLPQALSHVECRVERIEDDEKRPRFYCRRIFEQTHAPFKGFNRAQAAVLEMAILVSRLHMLPAEKIDREIDYLQIAIDKTAGERERMAWGWLQERVAAHRRQIHAGSGSIA